MKIFLLSCFITVMYLIGLDAVPAQTFQKGPSQASQTPDTSLLWPDDDVYAEAMKFARFLTDHGIVVQSVHRSTMQGFFRGVWKVAHLKTEQGILQAHFFPEPMGAENIKITERQEGERYIYSFSGQTEPVSNHVIDSRWREYFTTHRNLLIVTRNKELNAAVKRAFGRR